MKRRDFLKTVAPGAIALIMPRCRSRSGSSVVNKGKSPNIVFIMGDDLGYADLSCYGQKLIKTPQLDRLASQGTLFTQCYAGAAVCAPSRSVLMTGQHTGHTRVRDNSPKIGGMLEEFGEGSFRLPLKAEDITVAEVLKQSGYVTGITGKWGLGEPGTDGVPTRQGFDEWLGYLNQNHAPYYYTDFLWHNEKKMVIEANKSGKRRQYSHDLFTEFALDFILRHKDESFFLYVPYTIPHRNFEIPNTDPYTKESWPELAKIYAAMITRMDRDVGRILDLLTELKIDDNTLVFYTSDNGAEDKPWGNLFNSTGPFRGEKSSLYEGGLRIPMLVRWPGRVPAGRVNNAVWYFADVLPTFANLAGAAIPANIDGINILPTLLGKNQNLSDRFLYWEFPSKNFIQAVRWGDWKAVRPRLGQSLELYNLAIDIAEKNNVAAHHPGIVDRIEAYLKTARTDSPNWPLK